MNLQIIPIIQKMFNNSNYIGELISTLIIGAGGLATAFLAIYGVWKKILQPWFKESRNKRNAVEKVISHIENISNELSEVSKELRPNGGGSIKDQVKQIASDVKIIRVERDATFHLSKDAMFKNDADGHCVLANSALCTLFGSTQEQMLGLGWLNFIIEEDKKRIKNEWSSIIESGKEISSYYTVYNPVLEEYIPLTYKAIINRDSEGVISVIGMVEKTTKKIKRLTTA